MLSPEERRRVAYHEMGHALVAATLPGVDPVHKVSIIPRGVGALGETQPLHWRQKHEQRESSCTTGFVLFTLFVNGTTLRLAIRLLGLDRLSARDEALRFQLSLVRPDDAINRRLRERVRTANFTGGVACVRIR